MKKESKVKNVAEQQKYSKKGASYAGKTIFGIKMCSNWAYNN